MKREAVVSLPALEMYRALRQADWRVAAQTELMHIDSQALDQWARENALARNEQVRAAASLYLECRRSGTRMTVIDDLIESWRAALATIDASMGLLPEDGSTEI